jgi:glycosyltransferase involved in cell wall biosynthesis
MFSIPATFFLKTKVISWEHFNYYSDLNSKARRLGRILASRFSEKIVTLTEEDKYNYLNNLKCKTEVISIANPTPFEVDKRSQLQNKVCLAVGRLVHIKGFDILLRLWAKVIEEKEDWILQIVGSGEEEAKLKKICKDLYLENYVEFVPHTDNIEEYYLNASIYLMTSRFEGLPMTLIEAKSFGLPCISFDCKTGPKDIIKDNIDGYVVEEGNEEKFIERVFKLIENKEKRKLFGQKAAEDNRYKIKNIIDKWERLLDAK